MHQTTQLTAQLLADVVALTGKFAILTNITSSGTSLKVKHCKQLP